MRELLFLVVVFREYRVRIMFSLGLAGGDVVCARRNARAATAEKGEPVSEPYLESMLVVATPR